MLLPVSMLAMNQDSLSVFKNKKLSEQHVFLKERLNSTKNIEIYIATFLEQATAKKDTHYISKAYYVTHRFHRKLKEYVKAHDAIDEAISLATISQKDSLLGSYFHAKGATFYIQSNYTDALHYYLKAYDIMRTKGSIENRLTLQFDIATIKLKGRKTKEALADFEYIIQSYDSLIQTKPDSRFLTIRFIKMLNNTAKWYTEEAMYINAIDLYSKSLILSKSVAYNSGKCIAIGGKGNVYTAQKQYEKAIKKLDQALVIATSHKELNLISRSLKSFYCLNF
jgi:tetratricopeptide (TPR) repeat protein